MLVNITAESNTTKKSSEIESKNDSQKKLQIIDIANIYGIDLSVTYTGEEAAAFLLIMDEEALIKIEESYKAGYKQGVYEYAPKVEKLSAEKQGLERINTEEKNKNRFKVSFLNIPLWTIIGIIAGAIGTLFIQAGVF